MKLHSRKQLPVSDPPHRMRTQNQPKVVVVTGGSRGIGLALVQRFKKEGWIVATCATKETHLKSSPADFRMVCDVTQVHQVKSFVTRILRKLKRIDVLINNAGLTGTHSMNPEDSDTLWHQIINVNLHGTYYFCKYAGCHLPSQSGRIINIASNLAMKGVPDAIAYCSAKHGVLGLTRALAHYFAPRKINVHALCPGWVETEMSAARFEELQISKTAVEKTVPLKRLIQPEEVADFAYYLATGTGAAMITGQALTMDGGILA